MNFQDYNLIDDKIREMLKPWNIKETKNVNEIKKELIGKGLELTTYDDGNIKRYSVKEYGIEKSYFNVGYKMDLDNYKISAVCSDIVRL